MLALSARATAQSQLAKPRVMQEPGEVTDVIDAFDGADPFDVSISLGFRYLSKRARILRESAIYAPGLTTGGYTSRRLSVGQYVETTSKLEPKIEIGLFKDLALYSRVPVILSNARRIDAPEGGANAAALAGAPGQPALFSLPFNAPDRSGLEYLAIGLDFGVLNQARDVTKPTWLFGVETRIGIGEPMHACDADASPQCAHPGDVNRDGKFSADVIADDGTALESNAISAREAGVTRGTVGLEIHSLMSKRIKYIEPYGGFSALFEFQQDASDYGATDLEGALVNHPPIIGKVSLGMMIIPWENRERFGRLTFDLRFDGEYHSEGRDYSELFDALGSSSEGTLRAPKWARFTDNTACNTAAGGDCPRSVVDLGSEKSYFTGLAVIEPYGAYRASGALTWRASEHFKLNAGVAINFDQAHGISHDQPCNPNFKNDLGRSGPCHSAGQAITATGIPNPGYRPTINAVGRRFYVDESRTFEVFARGSVLF
jgi:hypothetical protein